MECFSIDESGYTGFDLLNMDQTFQGASAICIDPNEAQRLINEYFPELRSVELKYSSLARKEKKLERLIELQKDLLNNYKSVTYVCSKRYLLILMFLDYAVEPFYYARGHNFYENGQNYSLGSLLYYVGAPLLGSGFNDILSAFQAAMRLKTVDSIQVLIKNVRNVKWDNLPEAFGPIANECPDCIASILNEDTSTDAAMVVLQSLISRLEVISDGPYCIEHDRSENLKQYNSIIDKYINHQESIEFDATEITKIKFPLRLTSVTQVESKTNLGVQLADILIGSAIHVSKLLISKERSDYVDKVISLYKDNQIIHMLPDLNFDEQRKFRSGSQANQMIDYFDKNFGYT
jgi:hypothetical protein